MSRHHILLIIAMLSACFALSALAEDSPADATVEIGPTDTGDWHVSYSFAEPQTALAFARSRNDYRSATWTLETDDAQFGRAFDFDVIVFDKPTKQVSFSIIPLTSALEADYTPFVTFSDGGLAIFEGQFSLVPFEDLDAIKALEGDLTNTEAGPLSMDVKVASDQPIIVDGAVHEGSLTHRAKNGGTYIYMGNSEVETFDSFAVVLDQGLPDWLQARFDSDLGKIFSALETQWGFELEDKATVLLAFKGTSGEGFSASGGALDQLLMMEVGGSAFAEASFNSLSYLQWFFAHEAVHLFQTAEGAEFAGDSDAWIHEGAANTMAYAIIAAQLGEEDRQKFLSAVYANSFDECVAALEGGPLNTVSERDLFSANYACGDLIAQATDGFLKRKTLFEFWNRLIQNAVSLDQPRINETLYFTTMQLFGSTRAQRDKIRTIVEDELDDPAAALTDLLESAGLEPEFDGKGNLVKMNWPVYAAE
ncbi:hypothetical protein WNY37_17310 [Henriciella sp. AS95]|uniref:hypothetical protein n=1 Tax=Henriciella sp. AS95 TaxID=3135782 RepID=UPI00317C70CB